jgi:hypothetical protein
MKKGVIFLALAAAGLPAGGGCAPREGEDLSLERVVRAASSRDRSTSKPAGRPSLPSNSIGG